MASGLRAQYLHGVEYRWHDSATTIDAAQWNHLAERAGPTPLLNHEWLHHLERSGSTTAETGWIPRHLTLHEEGRIVGAVPLYLRDNSWGEFVFDFAFAEVADQIGAPYYPKLVGMSPATPSTAYAILVEPGREDELCPLLMGEIHRYCHDEAIPVLQFNYVLPAWRKRLEEQGLVPWEHHGYQWFNEEYRSFEDYLGRFRKGQRRNIRRERASIPAQGLSTRIISGLDAPDSLFQRMARYYGKTNEQFGPWAARFLTDRFFTTMPREVRRHLWFAAAFPAGETRWAGETGSIGDPPALAMLVRKGDHLLGRYWGTRIQANNLHFELCYYTPMEWAIREGIRTFDPGMGSEHKVRRGFRSLPVTSMHRFFDPRMEAILRANIGRINAMERRRIALLDAAVPYKGV
ncbi:MAG: GNAT family N-acetyltransferase [Spirochaetaceae bacterium]|nr:MAG: GNAT family N-acetyltransferase [Spirochaetaceae bacterium]